MNPPIFVPDSLRTWFENDIINPIKNPKQYHEDLRPVRRLHLLYGQPGSGMKEALGSLLLQYTIKFTEMILNDDKEFVLDQFQKIKQTEKEQLMLIVTGTPMFYDRDFNHLKQLRYLFIIVIGEEIPDYQSPFYRQFKSRVLMETPGVDFFVASMKYYMNEYVKWKGDSNLVKLTDDDYEQIAIRCCAYCLPKDIRTFIRRLFRSQEEITREHVDSLMFQPFHDTVDAPCIVNINRKPLQEKYHPDYHGRPSSVERKRPRSNESDV
jgi:hypothetical protein